MAKEARGKTGRILVIDDEESIRDSCRQVLTRQGLEVDVTEDGQSGLKAVELQKPDVIILDLIMPGKNGMQILQEMKKTYPEGVVVVITGHGTLESAIRALRAGAYDFLPKPFTPQELRTIVNRALEYRSLLGKTVQLEREKEKIRENFIVMLSHQMKSPLAAAAEWLEVLRGGLAGPLTEKQSILLEKVGSRIMHLLDLVEDFLKLSRLEATGKVEEVRELDLPDIARQAWELAKRESAGREVHFTINEPGAAGELPRLEGDEALIREVFVNLLSNGATHTPDGGAIGVRFLAAPESAMVEVSDTGDGIPPEELPFIFDEFFRGKSAQEHRVPGTGLGLTIVKRIVEAHGGTISVESTLGKGTTFVLKLPALQKVRRET